jgi:uncharacterized membrane protein YuzA (DUF378 family)
MKKRQLLDRIVFFLLLIGGLNWGLIGLFNLNLVGAIFGSLYGLTRLAYILIGLAAVYRFVVWVRVQIAHK